MEIQLPDSPCFSFDNMQTIGTILFYLLNKNPPNKRKLSNLKLFGNGIDTYFRLRADRVLSDQERPNELEAERTATYIAFMTDCYMLSRNMLKSS